MNWISTSSLSFYLLFFLTIIISVRAPHDALPVIVVVVVVPRGVIPVSVLPARRTSISTVALLWLTVVVVVITPSVRGAISNNLYLFQTLFFSVFLLQYIYFLVYFKTTLLS